MIIDSSLYPSLAQERDLMRGHQEKLEQKAALALLEEMNGFFDRFPYAVEFQDCMGCLVLRIRYTDEMLAERGWPGDEIGYATEEDRLDDDFIQPSIYGYDQYSPDRRSAASKEMWRLYEGACEAVDKDATCSLLWLNDDGTVNRENLPRLIAEQTARCGEVS